MEQFKRASSVRDNSGYYSTGLYRERKAQELTLVANVHQDFAALTHEVIELVSQSNCYYLITPVATATAATVNGNICFFLQAYERKEIACNLGDNVSVISATGGQINLVEKE